MGLRIGFLLVLTALLSGCGVSTSRLGDPTAESASAQVVEEYRLGVGDKIRMIVFNEGALSGEFSVSSNGAVSLPLIGDVHATGKTTNELQGDIQNKFKDGYLVDPKVSIEILKYRPFYILGEIKSPGEFPYSNGLTVLNAVATAQGFTYRAERRVIFIQRAGTDKEIPFKLTPELKVRPGDTIRVGERFF